MRKLPIVVVIPTKNEAENITSTVRSVIHHFAAVVVVDSDSTDHTRKLAKAAGAEVVPYTWNGAYPKKKQWCLDRVHTGTDWVFFLDGDETPSPELLAELRRIFFDGRPVKPAAFDIPSVLVRRPAAAARLHHRQARPAGPHPGPLPGAGRSGRPRHG